METIRLQILLFVLIVSFSCNSSNKISNEDEQWQLVWSDEFEYEGLPDPEKWAYDVGDGCPELCGWGNNELQYYTKDSIKNARVRNGILTIEAHNESIGTREFSSAKLVTKANRTGSTENLSSGQNYLLPKGYGQLYG